MEAVSAINPLKKISSEDQNRRSRQNASRSYAKTFFSEVLEDACEKEQNPQSNIQIRTSGYTRDALPFYNFINMREYC